MYWDVYLLHLSSCHIFVFLFHTFFSTQCTVSFSLVYYYYKWYVLYSLYILTGMTIDSSKPNSSLKLESIAPSHSIHEGFAKTRLKLRVSNTHYPCQYTAEQKYNFLSTCNCFFSLYIILFNNRKMFCSMDFVKQPSIVPMIILCCKTTFFKNPVLLLSTKLLSKNTGGNYFTDFAC